MIYQTDNTERNWLSALSTENRLIKFYGINMALNIPEDKQSIIRSHAITVSSRDLCELTRFPHIPLYAAVFSVIRVAYFSGFLEGKIRQTVFKAVKRTSICKNKAKIYFCDFGKGNLP